MYKRSKTKQSNNGKSKLRKINYSEHESKNRYESNGGFKTMNLEEDESSNSSDSSISSISSISSDMIGGGGDLKNDLIKILQKQHIDRYFNTIITKMNDYFNSLQSKINDTKIKITEELLRKMNADILQIAENINKTNVYITTPFNDKIKKIKNLINIKIEELVDSDLKTKLTEIKFSDLIPEFRSESTQTALQSSNILEQARNSSSKNVVVQSNATDKEKFAYETQANLYKQAMKNEVEKYKTLARLDIVVTKDIKGPKELDGGALTDAIVAEKATAATKTAKNNLKAAIKNAPGIGSYKPLDNKTTLYKEQTVKGKKTISNDIELFIPSRLFSKDEDIADVLENVSKNNLLKEIYNDEEENNYFVRIFNFFVHKKFNRAYENFDQPTSINIEDIITSITDEANNKVIFIKSKLYLFNIDKYIEKFINDITTDDITTNEDKTKLQTAYDRFITGMINNDELDKGKVLLKGFQKFYYSFHVTPESYIDMYSAILLNKKITELSGGDGTLKAPKLYDLSNNNNKKTIKTKLKSFLENDITNPASGDIEKITTNNDKNANNDIVEKRKYYKHWETLKNASNPFDQKTLFTINKEFTPVSTPSMTSKEVRNYLIKCEDLQIFYINKHILIYEMMVKLSDLLKYNKTMCEQINKLTSPTMYINRKDDSLDVKLKPLITDINKYNTYDTSIITMANAIFEGKSSVITPIAGTVPTLTGLTRIQFMNLEKNKDSQQLFSENTQKKLSDFGKNVYLIDDDSTTPTKQKDVTIQELLTHLTKEIKPFYIKFGENLLNFRDYMFKVGDKKTITLTINNTQYTGTIELDYLKEHIKVTLSTKIKIAVIDDTFENITTITIPNLHKYIIKIEPKISGMFNRIGDNKTIYYKNKEFNDQLLMTLRKIGNELYFENLNIANPEDTNSNDKYQHIADILSRCTVKTLETKGTFNMIRYYIDSVASFNTLQYIKEIQDDNFASLSSILGDRDTSKNSIDKRYRIEILIEKYKEKIKLGSKITTMTATDKPVPLTPDGTLDKRWTDFDPDHEPEKIDQYFKNKLDELGGPQDHPINDKEHLQQVIYRCYDLQVLFMIKHLEVVYINNIIFYYMDMLAKQVAVLLFILSLYKRYNFDINEIGENNLIDVFEKVGELIKSQDNVMKPNMAGGAAGPAGDAGSVDTLSNILLNKIEKSKKVHNLGLPVNTSATPAAASPIATPEAASQIPLDASSPQPLQALQPPEASTQIEGASPQIPASPEASINTKNATSPKIYNNEPNIPTRSSVEIITILEKNYSNGTKETATKEIKELRKNLETYNGIEGLQDIINKLDNLDDNIKTLPKEIATLIETVKAMDKNNIRPVLPEVTATSKPIKFKDKGGDAEDKRLLLDTLRKIEGNLANIILTNAVKAVITLYNTNDTNDTNDSVKAIKDDKLQKLMHIISEKNAAIRKKIKGANAFNLYGLTSVLHHSEKDMKTYTNNDINSSRKTNAIKGSKFVKAARQVDEFVKTLKEDLVTIRPGLHEDIFSNIANYTKSKIFKKEAEFNLEAYNDGVTSGIIDDDKTRKTELEARKNVITQKLTESSKNTIRSIMKQIPKPINLKKNNATQSKVITQMIADLDDKSAKEIADLLTNNIKLLMQEKATNDDDFAPVLDYINVMGGGANVTAVPLVNAAEDASVELTKEEKAKAKAALEFFKNFLGDVVKERTTAYTEKIAESVKLQEDAKLAITDELNKLYNDVNFGQIKNEKYPSSDQTDQTYEKKMEQYQNDVKIYDKDKYEEIKAFITDANLKIAAKVKQKNDYDRLNSLLKAFQKPDNPVYEDTNPLKNEIDKNALIPIDQYNQAKIREIEAFIGQVNNAIKTAKETAHKEKVDELKEKLKVIEEKANYIKDVNNKTNISTYLGYDYTKYTPKIIIDVEEFITIVENAIADAQKVEAAAKIEAAKTLAEKQTLQKLEIDELLTKLQRKISDPNYTDIKTKKDNAIKTYLDLKSVEYTDIQYKEIKLFITGVNKEMEDKNKADKDKADLAEKKATEEQAAAAAKLLNESKKYIKLYEEYIKTLPDYFIDALKKINTNQTKIDEITEEINIRDFDLQKYIDIITGGEVYIQKQQQTDKTVLDIDMKIIQQITTQIAKQIIFVINKLSKSDLTGQPNYFKYILPLSSVWNNIKTAKNDVDPVIKTTRITDTITKYISKGNTEINEDRLLYIFKFLYAISLLVEEPDALCTELRDFIKDLSVENLNQLKEKFEINKIISGPNTLFYSILIEKYDAEKMIADLKFIHDNIRIIYETILGAAMVIVRIKPLRSHNTAPTYEQIKDYLIYEPDPFSGESNVKEMIKNFNVREYIKMRNKLDYNKPQPQLEQSGGYNYDDIIKLKKDEGKLSFGNWCSQVNGEVAGTNKVYGPFAGIYTPEYNNFDIYKVLFGLYKMYEKPENYLPLTASTDIDPYSQNPLIEYNKAPNKNKGLLSIPTNKPEYLLKQKLELGGNVVLFGYGFSGSGKTYALLEGNKMRSDKLETNPLQSQKYDPSLLEQFIKDNVEFVTSVDFVDIYPLGIQNEKKTEDDTLNIRLFYGNKTPTVPPTSPTSKNKIYDTNSKYNSNYDSILKTAENKNRLFDEIKNRIDKLEIHRREELRICATPNNDSSSRSFLQITINLTNNKGDGKKNKIIFFDMPGSENTVRLRTELLGNEVLKYFDKSKITYIDAKVTDNTQDPTIEINGIELEAKTDKALLEKFNKYFYIFKTEETNKSHETLYLYNHTNIEKHNFDDVNVIIKKVFKDSFLQGSEVRTSNLFICKNKGIPDKTAMTSKISEELNLFLNGNVEIDIKSIYDKTQKVELLPKIKMLNPKLIKTICLYFIQNVILRKDPDDNSYLYFNLNNYPIKYNDYKNFEFLFEQTDEENFSIVFKDFNLKEFVMDKDKPSLRKGISYNINNEVCDITMFDLEEKYINTSKLKEISITSKRFNYKPDKKHPLIKYIIFIISQLLKNSSNEDLFYGNLIIHIFNYIKFIVKQGEAIVTNLEHLKFFFLSNTFNIDKYNNNIENADGYNETNDKNKKFEFIENSPNNPLNNAREYIVDTEAIPGIKLKEKINIGNMQSYKLLSVLQDLAGSESKLTALGYTTSDKTTDTTNKKYRYLDLFKLSNEKSSTKSVSSEKSLFIMFTNIKIFRDSKDDDVIEYDNSKTKMELICGAEKDTLDFAQSISSTTQTNSSPGKKVLPPAATAIAASKAPAPSELPSPQKAPATATRKAPAPTRKAPAPTAPSVLPSSRKAPPPPVKKKAPQNAPPPPVKKKAPRKAPSTPVPETTPLPATPPPATPPASNTPPANTLPANTTPPQPANTTPPQPANTPPLSPEPKPTPEPSEQPQLYKALFNFEAEEKNELAVKENEIVSLIKKNSDDWFKVKNNKGEEGEVASNYLIAVEKLKSYKANFKFEAEDATDLELKEGDIVYLINDIDENWANVINMNTKKFGMVPKENLKEQPANPSGGSRSKNSSKNIPKRPQRNFIKKILSFENKKSPKKFNMKELTKKHKKQNRIQTVKKQLKTNNKKTLYSRHSKKYQK